MIKRKLHKMMNILNYFVYSSKQQLKKNKRDGERKGAREGKVNGEWKEIEG